MKQERRQLTQSPDKDDNTMFNGGRYALGVISGIIFSILLYLSFGFFDLTLSRSEILDIVPTSIALLVAFVSVILSYSALSEQRLMRQAGTDPVILVHLSKREDTRALATFEVSNVGAGAALEVKIKLLSDISKIEAGKIVVDFSKIKHPIRTIPQGNSISYNFGVGHKLLGENPVPPLNFEISYENIEGAKYKSFQTIDVRELHQQRADTPALARIAKASEGIAKSTDKIARASSPHKVVTETREDYQRRRIEENEQLLNEMKQTKEDSV